LEPRAAGDAYQIDAVKSRVTIVVGKAGAFSFLAGHTHEVSGPIESGSLDIDPDNPSRSQVRIVIAASSLKVSGADEPPKDRPKVQEAMESDKVLDVARFPRITFESTNVTTTRQEGATLDVVVAGQLTIREIMRPVSAPVHVDRRIIDRQRPLCRHTVGVRYQAYLRRRRGRSEGQARHRVLNHRAAVTAASR
jgi:polyisoprenoid-binding protein YceI